MHYISEFTNCKWNFYKNANSVGKLPKLYLDSTIYIIHFCAYFQFFLFLFSNYFLLIKGHSFQENHLFFTGVHQAAGSR